MRSLLATLLVGTLMTGCVGTLQSGLGGTGPGLVASGAPSASPAGDAVERALAAEPTAPSAGDAAAADAYGQTLLVLGAAVVSVNSIARSMR